MTHLQDRVRNKLWRTLYSLKDRVRDMGSVTPLDYEKSDLMIIADTFRERNIRAKSCQKEPGTIRWMEKNIAPGTVFYDIGANIGAYSLVAARLKAEVLAFEPAYQNFFQLNRNTSLNGCDGSIATYQVAFSQATKVGKFQFIETTPGTSKCYYNEAGEFHLKTKPLLEKSVLVFSLDDFIKIFSLPAPELLKIDVDGAEGDVIRGARETLKNPTLRSVQIEIDESQGPADEILGIVKGSGFVLESQERFVNSVSNFVFIRG